MNFGTTHIRQMLDEAIDACLKVEQIAQHHQTVVSGQALIEAERLLSGAAVNAQHAAMEIQDELFRLKYGDNGYTK